MPINSRKLSASIFTVGYRSTNSASGFDMPNIIATAMTIAAAMTQIALAMPTAVITLSSENTMSSSTICTITPLKEIFSRGFASPGPSPSRR